MRDFFELLQFIGALAIIAFIATLGSCVTQESYTNRISNGSVIEIKKEFYKCFPQKFEQLNKEGE